MLLVQSALTAESSMKDEKAVGDLSPSVPPPNRWFLWLCRQGPNMVTKICPFNSWCNMQEDQWHVASLAHQGWSMFVAEKKGFPFHFSLGETSIQADWSCEKRAWHFREMDNIQFNVFLILCVRTATNLSTFLLVVESKVVLKFACFFRNYVPISLLMFGL